MRGVRIVLPVAALLAVSVAVGACAGSGGGSKALEAGGGGGVAVEAGAATVAGETMVTRDAAQPAVGAAETGAATPAETSGGGGGVAATPVAALGGSVEQRIVQTAVLSLEVKRDELADALAEARTIAAGYGGFVTGSSTSQGADERIARGTLVVRVPQRAYADAMAAFAKLGTVKSQQESGEDVSQQYVDLEARRRHLEAVEAQLLGFLKRTTTVAQALAVQSRLDAVQLELERVRGQLRYLDDQTSYATITLQVAEKGVQATTLRTKEKGSWGLSDAWHAAVRGLEKVLGGLFVALVTAGPILGILLAAFLAWRAWSRRRRGTPPATGPAPSGR